MASNMARLQRKIKGHLPDCSCGPCSFKRKRDAEFTRKYTRTAKGQVAPRSAKSSASVAKAKARTKRRHALTVFAKGAVPQSAKPVHASTPLQSAGAVGITATAAVNSGSAKPLYWLKARWLR